MLERNTREYFGDVLVMVLFYLISFIFHLKALLVL